MKLFAVLLASIAALAATAQTYFIWGGKAANQDTWSVRNIESSRNLSCRSLLDASASLARINNSTDEIIERAVSQYRVTAEEYATDEVDSERTEKLALQMGRRALISTVNEWTSRVSGFVDVDYLYFSGDELSMLGHDIWREFAIRNELYSSYSYYYGSVGTEEEFAAFRESIQKVGDLHDSIKEVCTPILLKK